MFFLGTDEMATPKNTQFDNVCASFLLIAMDCENVGLGPSAGGHRMPLGIDRRRRTNKLQHTHTCPVSLEIMHHLCKK